MINKADEGMATHVCAMCGRPGTSYLLLQINGFRVARCKCCNGESCIDVPDHSLLAAAYQSFDAGRLAKEDFAAYAKQASNILKREISNYLSKIGGNYSDAGFFDYGCGGGHFVEAARVLGMRATGLELDSTSVSFGQSRGLNIKVGTFPANLELFSGGDFVFVRSMHVLEHVPSPLEVLTSLKYHTASGGIIIIGVPDQGSFPARLKKILRNFGIKCNEWGFVQPPIHIHGFFMSTLVEMAAILDLELVELRKTSPLDVQEFPSTSAYWKGLFVQKLIYILARMFNSPGHLKAVFRKR